MFGFFKRGPSKKEEPWRDTESLAPVKIVTRSVSSEARTIERRRSVASWLGVERRRGTRDGAGARLRAVTDTANDSNMSLAVLNTADDLAALGLPFERILEEVPIGSHLKYSICPVLLGGALGTPSAQVALLVRAGYERSDETIYLADQLLGVKGAQVWEARPLIVCSGSLILSVVKKLITKDVIQIRRGDVTGASSSGAYNALREVVSWALAKKASDITLTLNNNSATSQISFIIAGVNVSPPMWAMPTGTLNGILNTAYGISEGGAGAIWDPSIEQDCRISLAVDGIDVLLRWSSFASEYPGPSVTTRVVRQSVVSGQEISALGYLPYHCEVIARGTTSEGGSMLFAGPVNSGKTETIATVLANLPPTRKIMTIESPVERLIAGAIQRNVTGSFKPALDTIKRSAMHDVLMGEIRNVEEGIAYTGLSEMKVNVYSTTHTDSPANCYSKLMGKDVQISRDFLSTPGVIKCIIAQSLVAKNCNCAVKFTTLLSDSHPERGRWKSYSDRLERLYRIDIDAIKIIDPEGCIRCRSLGLPELYGINGRQLVAEAFEPDDHSLELVKEGNMLGLTRYIASQSDGDYSSDAMRGKTVMECAVYQMTRGVLDPRQVERRFYSFEREEFLRAGRKAHSPGLVSQLLHKVG